VTVWESQLRSRSANTLATFVGAAVAIGLDVAAGEGEGQGGPYVVVIAGRQIAVKFIESAITVALAVIDGYELPEDDPGFTNLFEAPSRPSSTATSSRSRDSCGTRSCSPSFRSSPQRSMRHARPEDDNT
jgi:hypothetical protein